MPELPDLQVFSFNLTKILKGKKLDQVTVPVPKKLNVQVSELKSALEGQELKKVVRVGKELHFEFQDHILGMHLMLHGQLKLFEKQNDQKFAIIELLFNDGTGLALSDFQKAATPTLDPESSDTPDALDVTTEYLKKKFSATRAPVKTVLMDQKILRGIGNAYADEILYDAKLSPFSASNKIPEAKIRTLAASIRNVLEEAEKEIKKKHSDIISGEVRDFLKVHQPKKKETANGESIHQKPVGARKTYYTDVQELFE